jgi:hypothetical protein
MRWWRSVWASPAYFPVNMQSPQGQSNLRDDPNRFEQQQQQQKLRKKTDMLGGDKAWRR